MKRTKLWVIVVFAVVIMSGILLAFATEQFKTIPIESKEVQEYRQPPENATIIPSPGLITFPFELSLEASQIAVSKGQSRNVRVTIYFTEKANLSLTVRAEASMLPELPPGIIACLDQTEIKAEASSRVTVNLVLSVESQATSGTYTLQIFATQKLSHGHVTMGVPLQLTIP